MKGSFHSHLGRQDLPPVGAKDCLADASSLARAFKRAGWKVIGVEERG